MTSLDLTGRTALVTGAAQGLGEGMARALSAAGATVVVADVQDELGGKVAESVGGHFVHLDVTDESSWEAAISAAVEQAGGLDVVVNNAGVEISDLIMNVDPDDVMKMLTVNVLGTTLGIKHAFRAMGPGGAAGHAEGGGVVINIASVAATIAFPAISAYSATKSAVDRLTRVAAMESGKLGLGIRVNCVYPGLVPTEMGAGLANDMARLGLFGSAEEAVGAVVELTPSGRLGAVEDMADAVVFLASDAARFVNGIGLPVDGGMGM
ncbi:SDR family NAD(P)-dependent oxidoreductase [Nocardioides sp. CFH 31398]|uniref:SDR family NAD(P)-dependent oxidoreductase n=1 Tax=Nocardioides sp. CFH 31398 TaxID=2919579 RepID=UPI001F052C85|nr:SDR family oxidoreductase [Nocardioides sp. CFH 31398]MCH1868544.1 SDR family oxidoreductase [Nocardioides sp. CFH 31398]